MEIRALQEADSRRAVSRIYEESWKFAYRGIIPQSYLDGIPAGLWARSLDQPGRDHLVVLEDGGPIGTASTGPSRWPDYPEDGEIVSLYLLPAYIGRGYGKALLAAAVRVLEAQGYRSILLWVLAENRRARAFYERAGFHMNGAVMKSVFGGKRVEELLYRRQISCDAESLPCRSR